MPAEKSSGVLFFYGEKMSKVTEVIGLLKEELGINPKGGPISEAIKTVGDNLGVDWTKIPFSEFEAGYYVELEHGLKSPQTNVTNDDMTATLKIALAHLNELPDYYTRLAKMEKEGGVSESLNEGTLSDKDKTTIENWLRDTEDIKDSKFHKMVVGLGLEPDVAETYVYQLAQRLLKRQYNG